MNPCMPAGTQLDITTRAEAPSSEKDPLTEWGFTSGESLMIHSNKDHTSSKKASYPHIYPRAFLPANSRIACLQMNPAHNDQIKTSKIQSALTTIINEAQQIDKIMTRFVVAMPELKGKLLRLAQIVAYVSSLLEPEMSLMAQNHNYNTSATALQAILKQEIPGELQADLLRDYAIYDRYFSVSRNTFNCYGRDLCGWPDPVYNAFKAFHEIDIQDNEHAPGRGLRLSVNLSALLLGTVAAILLFPGAAAWIVWSETNGRVPAPLIVGLILAALVLLVTRPLRWR